MKRVIRLTESDLVRIVKRVISEQSTPPANLPWIDKEGKYKNISTKEDIEEILKLIEEAREQSFDDEDRIRPFDFTYSSGVRNILTDKKIEKRAWQGVKRL